MDVDVDQHMTEGSENQCYVEDCDSPVKYLLQWCGVNQHGKDPLIRWERYVCIDPKHVLKAAEHDDYGGCPDDVCDPIELSKSYPNILDMIRGKNASLADFT